MSPTSSVFDYFKNSSNSSAASTPTTATATTTATHSFNRTQGKGFNESTADQLQREQDGQAIAQATTQILTHTTPQQKKKRMIKTTMIVIGWFASTVLLISFNKILMRDGSKFRLPIFLTFMHMCVAYVCCEIVLSLSGQQKRQSLQSNRQFWKVFALSQTFAVSIVAAVASLEYLEVSFEQAIAACTPAVTAFLGVLILRKREHWRVWLSLTPVILGGLVTAGAEPTFHAKGLALVLASMIARATKSCLQELLLSSSSETDVGSNNNKHNNESEKLDSLNSLRWMSLMSVCTLFPASVEFEGVCAIKAALRSAYDNNELALALAANCAGAFLVNISQFLVTQHVGALSMQVLGNVKTIVTVIFSVVIFKNVVGLRSLIGYVLTLLGCFVYLREKRKRDAVVIIGEKEIVLNEFNAVGGGKGAVGAEHV
jgi:drug/metabolite transporter (DMT)-like permease